MLWSLIHRLGEPTIITGAADTAGWPNSCGCCGRCARDFDLTPSPPIPSAVGPHSCGAGVVQGVKVERPAGRTTLTPWAATARLARVDGRWDGSPPLTTMNVQTPASWGHLGAG